MEGEVIGVLVIAAIVFIVLGAIACLPFEYPEDDTSDVSRIYSFP